MIDSIARNWTIHGWGFIRLVPGRSVHSKLACTCCKLFRMAEEAVAKPLKRMKEMQEE